MKPIQPDAHLRAALKHAPDAAAQAPADLSAQIVAAAHRAAAEAPERAAQPAGSWWPWRRTWRMGASGAFASVLMAGVIGLMWQGEPPGPAREEAAPASAAPATPVATARPPATALPPAAAVAAGIAAAPTPEQPPAVGLAPADASPQRARRVMDIAPMPMTMPMPMPAPAPALEAARAAASPAASLSLSGSRVAVGTASSPGTGGAMSTALAPAAKARSSLAATVPWSGVLAEDSSAGLFLPSLARTADPALLQAVLRHTAGRWTADTSAHAQPDETPLEWRQGDQVLGRLWLGEQRALLCPPPGVQAACQVAPLSPQAAAELKEKLPQ